MIRQWSSYRYLKWSDIKRRHIVFTAAFVVVVDNILANIVVRARVFDVGFATPIVYHEDQYQNWNMKIRSKTR